MGVNQLTAPPWPRHGWAGLRALGMRALHDVAPVRAEG